MRRASPRRPRPAPAVGATRPTYLDSLIWLLEAGLLSLATWFGLQELRVFVPTLVHTLGDLAPPAFVGGFALGLVALMWVAPFLWRSSGTFGAWVFPVGGLVVLRLLEQWSGYPAADLVFSGVAVVCLAVLTVVAPQHEQATGRGARGMAVWPWALGVGLLLDTAVRSILLTVDLPWRRDALGYGATLVFGGLTMWLLVEWVRRWQGPDARSVGDPSLVSTLPWMAVPLFLFLYAEQFGQVSLLASLGGLSFPWAAGWGVLGHLLALALGWALLSRAGMDAGDWPVVLLAGGALILALSGIAKGGWVSVAFWPVGQAVAFLLTVFATSAPLLASPRPRGRWQGTLPVFLGWWTFVALLFAREVQGASWADHAAAVLLAMCALWAVRLILPGQALRLVRRRLWERGGAACGVLLVLLVVGVGTMLLPPPRLASAPLQEGVVRVVTYNVHRGFNVQGSLDVERLSRTLKEAQADIVGLNEVSRGRLLDGGVDVLLWLTYRLGMRAEFGPTVEGLYGNALLSRYPIVGVQNFPFETYRSEPRGCLLTTVQVGERQVLVMVTHLDHQEEAAPERATQVAELLALWGKRAPAVLLGDFNAEPGAPELSNLKAAGWVDVASALEERPAATFPSAAPIRRIDYIFVTSDVRPLEVSVPFSLSSDHLPVVATLQLP